MASTAQAQLVIISDAKVVTTTHQVTETSIIVDGQATPMPPDAGEKSEEKKSQTKLIETSLSSLASYGPATIEFETLDGVDASKAFRPAGEDRWIVVSPGKYRVIALAVEKDTFRIKREKYLVESDGIPDNPDAPDAQVGDNLKVLVVYETEDLTKQRFVSDIIASPIVRNYLRSKARRPDGTENFRFFDQHTTFSSCAPDGFCKAMQRPRASLPWVIISNDKTSFEGPLPAGVSDFLKLLRSYGG